MKKSLLLIAFLFSLFASSQIVYVDINATGANNGSSWTNAYTDLNAAIDGATNTEVWIAAGSYLRAGNRSTAFNLGSGMELYGGFNGTEVTRDQRDPETFFSILTGDIQNNDIPVTSIDFNDTSRSENKYNIVNIDGDNVVLDGLIVSGGNANGANFFEQEGSAIIVNDSENLRINNCTVSNQINNRGAAIRAFASDANATMSLFIDRCLFTENLARFGTSLLVSTTSSSNYDTVISNSVFTRNETKNITGNDGNSGVMWFRNDTGNNNVATVVNCTFTDNDFQGTGYSGTGPMIAASKLGNSNTELYVFNSIFWNNQLAGRGTAMTAIGNYGQESAQIYQIRNSLSPEGFSNISDKANTIISDPQFNDPSIGDYSLQSASNCIDSGNEILVPMGVAQDFEGNVRIQGGSVDRGAYETSDGGNPVVVYVDASATGANNGSNWTNAYVDLQSALNSSLQRYEIWIAAGTYSPGNARADSFNLAGSRISLYGGFNGTETTLSQRDPDINITTLTGDVNRDDSGVDYTGVNRDENNVHVITITTAGEARIDGITISGGHANDTSSNIGQEGSAILIEVSSDVIISNCVIENNVVTRAGVIQKVDSNGTLSINNSRISDNLGNSAVILYTRATTGVLDVNLDNCLINNNVTEGLASTNRSGIIWFRQDADGTTNSTITNCTVVNNNNPTAPLRSILLSASRLNGGFNNASIYNSIFYDNKWGGSNDVVQAVGGQFGQNTANNFTVRNSIDEDNFSDITDNGSTRVKQNVSTSNPLFTDASNKDYTLLSTSPAIDAGDNSFVNTTSDLVGNNRIANTNVDMGAYEFGSTAGIDEVTIEEIRLYPNPASTILNVGGVHAFAKAYLFNLQGQLMMESSQKKIDVQELKAGIYLINILDENGVSTTKKFVKN
ncbi:MAG: choice-of-anchor Q domain-containing protein [Nonlabens sp.]